MGMRRRFWCWLLGMWISDGEERLRETDVGVEDIERSVGLSIWHSRLVAQKVFVSVGYQ